MTPTRIHVYNILGPLEPTSLGRSFRARATTDSGDVPRGTEVCLRWVAPDENLSPAAIEELNVSLERARGLSCDAIHAPLDHGIEDGCVWWANRIETGRLLSELLEVVPSVPDPLVESIASQVATALDALHGVGLRGVGLAPERILLRDDSSVVLLDSAAGSGVRASWPQTGEAPTSMICAAPEFLTGQAPIDERTDLYALGAVLFRCCTGRWHRSHTDSAALRAAPNEPDAPRIRDHKPSRSPFLTEVVATLLQVDPEQRFQSVSQLWEALAQRRESDWWKERDPGVADSVVQRTDDGETTQEPAPLPIPEAADLPSDAWIVECARRPRQLAPHLAPCVGRDRELSALMESLEKIRPQAGSVLLLEGEDGIGKTRLMDAVLASVAALPPEQAPILLVGEHRQRGVGRPLQAFSEAVTSWLGESREVREEDVFRLLGAAAGIAPAFTAFLSGVSVPDGHAQLSRESLAAAFGSTLTTLCSFRPVLFVVENLQWADPEGLDLFGYLARRAGRLPVLLLATHRPAPEGSPLASLLASVSALPHAERNHLVAPVTSHTAELVAEVVTPKAQAEGLGARIHAETGGNPLLTIETLHLLRAENVLVAPDSGDGAWVAQDSMASAHLPSSFPELFRRRFDALSNDSSTYLEMASVQGVMFDTDVVRAALDWDPPRATKTLVELEASALLFGTSPARRFSSHALFLHVGDSLSEDALRSHHKATASAFLSTRNPHSFSPEDCHGILCYRVAWHDLFAEEFERGLAYIAPALKHLRETWRIGDAERLALRAAHALRQLEGREIQAIDMLLARSELLALEGRRDDQARALDEALLLARSVKDSSREAQVLLESTRLYFVTHRMKRARETGRETLVVSHAAGEKRVEARCQYLLGSVAYHEARYQDARQHMQRALELSRDLFDAATEAEALQALGTISQGVGSFEHAEQLQRMAMRLYREQGDLAHEAETLSSLGNIAAAAGDAEQAEEFLTRALGIQRSMANGYAEAQILSHMGMMFQDQGRFLEARDAHIACLQVSRDMGAEVQQTVASLNLAAVESVLGNLDATRDLNGDALRAARPARDPRLIGYALSGLGDVARQRGEWDVAQDLFRRAIKQFRKVDDTHGMAAALLGAGRTELVCGDPTDAEELLLEAVELAGPRRARIVTALARAQLALMRARAGNAEEAQSWIARAGALVHGVRGTDLITVEVRFVHSLLLRVLGSRVEADRMMLRAESLLREATSSLPESDRERMFTSLTPYREILAGSDMIRSTPEGRKIGLEDTVEV